MIVVDSSVLCCVVFKEDDADDLRSLLEEEPVLVPAHVLLETYITLTNRGVEDADLIVEGLVRQANVEVGAFGEDERTLATDAFRRFGKGRHPARLNFGDCMSYAIARARAAPLLFKGADFGLTDIEAHPASVQLTPR